MSEPAIVLRLREKARALRRRITLPEIDDARIREARTLLERDALAEVVWIERPAAHPRFGDAVQHFHRRLSHKGVSEAEARQMAADRVFFGAALVALGEADACVCGAATGFGMGVALGDFAATMLLAIVGGIVGAIAG